MSPIELSWTAKKTPKSAIRLIFIWEKGTFLFAQLCLVVAKTCRPARSERFFWPKTSDFRKMVHFAPSDWFSDFSFPRYSCFCKKKTGRHVKKSFPTPLWGNRLPVTTLALSVGWIIHLILVNCNWWHLVHSMHLETKVLHSLNVVDSLISEDRNILAQAEAPYGSMSVLTQ